MKGYHAHIYFSREEKELAGKFRIKIIAELPLSRMSELILQEVGPHTQPMFNFSFASQDYERIKRWLEQYHGGFPVLIHPLSGNDLEDHTNLAVWLGKELPLKTSIFIRHQQKA